MRSRYNSPNSPTGKRDALNLAVFQRISGRIVSRRIIPINARLFKSSGRGIFEITISPDLLI